MSHDLTHLAALKSWLGMPAGASTQDATLAALIGAASRSIYATLSRPALLPQSYSEVLDAESERVFLRCWPVLEVKAVTLDGKPVPPAPPANARHGLGWLLRPDDNAPPGRQQALDIFGRRVRPGRQNLAVEYVAGYAIQGEAHVVSSAEPWTIDVRAPYGPWGHDMGVAYAANGEALTRVASAPAAGQYSVSRGAYVFSADDAGSAVAISYGYVPQDVAQAALELAAERFRAADRIGLRSKSLGGQETIAYDVSSISAPVLALLQPYRRVAV
ncbi:MAG TPA: hypothetical protein VGH40_18475 [Roseiarcus sp.]|jgi:hypothetical protein